ncbi:TPA: hypothetical protein ACF2DD_002069 [Clostridium perfringens]|uniref:hypothetical protein n=1 Tax=Clostridium perfringens TaxID=1502 RepID=UPI0029082B01|nr:hypothetical protein [Clostridium perfringens]
MDNKLYKRYLNMEKEASESEVGTDFREEIADKFGFALRDGKENMTLKEFLVEIEEWFKEW